MGFLCKFLSKSFSLHRILRMQGQNHLWEKGCAVGCRCDSVQWDHGHMARTAVANLTFAWFDVTSIRLAVEATYKWALSKSATTGIAIVIAWILALENIVAPFLACVISIQCHRIRLLKTGTKKQALVVMGATVRTLLMREVSAGANYGFQDEERQWLPEHSWSLHAFSNLWFREWQLAPPLFNQWRT